MGAAAANAQTSWEIGSPTASSVVATLNTTDSILTISGTGAMADYTISSGSRAPWYESRDGITSVIISSGVTAIGNNAFYNCTKLTSISIPASVNTIGDGAFRGCTVLPSISIPAGVTAIGNGAFYNCSGLTSINIPDGVTTIGTEAFRGCTVLPSINIPDGITSIGNSAFQNCSGLTSINIPAGVTTIGGFAFTACTGLTSIYANRSTPATLLGNYVFYQVNTSACTLYVPAGATAGVTKADYEAVAQWNAFTNIVEFYTVTFDEQGGSTVSSQPVASGDTATQPADPTLTGYEFGGWYKEAACTTAWVFASDVVNSDITLYAKWLEIYSITYHLNSGTGASNSTYTIESAAITLPTPSRANYTFAGWYDDAGFTGSAVTTIATGSTGNKAFYAKWLETYSITYHLNGGTGVNDSTYTVETAVTLPTPSLTGYEFAGWYGDAGFSGSAVTTIATGSTGNKAFYAKWTASYTITYDLDGGTNNVNNPATYTIESATITLQDPTKDGYTFVGWSNGGVIAAGSTGDTTFTASWTAVSYSITYHLDGGTGATNSTYTIESAAVTLPTPSRTGYEFAGWYGDAGFTGSAVTTIAAGSTGDKAFYAKWTAIPATAVVAQSAQKLQVYPTIVTNGQLTIDNGQLSAGGKVEVYSLTGGLAGVYNVSGGASTTINIAHLPAGIYIVRVGNKAAKVVKQ
ncbi:hypothetical protein FACS189452_05740 [Bacteroidia bacterium]|nr:hypothetical protein FACS189452_05740 [Bacteroidia bacterium]